jgi:molybdenum cofactor synthesis domain-containing protein
MKQVEIITVGSELLLGSILDTNSNWVCKQISGLGGQVNRVVLVQDDVDGIATEIRTALAHGVDFVFTLGGLGPTSDDMTLEAVAKVTGNELEPNAAALAFVQRRYEAFYRDGSVDSPTMTESRRKMGVLPRDSVLLDNRVGAAPSVLLILPSGIRLVCLPGVPREMKDVFTNSLTAVLRECFGSGAFAERTLVTDCKDESLLVPILREVAAQLGDVYIKSLTDKFGPDVQLQIKLALRADTHDQVISRLDRAQQILEQSLHERGITVLKTGE